MLLSIEWNICAKLVVNSLLEKDKSKTTSMRKLGEKREYGNEGYKIVAMKIAIITIQIKKIQGRRYQ